MNAIVTGGLGYIGSHTVVQLAACGSYARIDIVDDLSNAPRERMAALERLCAATATRLALHVFGFGEAVPMCALLRERRYDVCLHFAARKSVPESVRRPAAYYATNVCDAIALVGWLRAARARTFVFSSSCAVYGERAGEAAVGEDDPSVGVHTNAH